MCKRRGGRNDKTAAESMYEVQLVLRASCNARTLGYLAATLMSFAPGFAAELSAGRDATKLYAQFCASCHGEDLNGGKGGSLVSGQWKHGGDDASLLRSIQQGYPDGGMPAFSSAINQAETLSLITFMRETATRNSEPELRKSHELPLGVQSSEEHAYRLESVAEGLDVPWSLSFLPDGRILVTERVGHLRVIEQGRLRAEPIEGVPAVVVKDEAGLMSVVVHPDFARNQLVYLSLSDPGEGNTAMTKIVRAQLHGNQLENHEVIFSIPRGEYQDTFVLFGGGWRLPVSIYFSASASAASRKRAPAKRRISPRPREKFTACSTMGRCRPIIPSSGRQVHWAPSGLTACRNPQGLAYEAGTGSLWETEHGPRGGDELNFIQRGRNYGWPVITFGMNYDGKPITDKTEQAGMEQPVVNWTPSIAASEIEFYRGDRFPKWKHNLFVGSLAQQKFLRFVVADGKVTHQEEIFKNLGRVRDIKTGPDGFIYLALELVGEPGRIVRLVPAEDTSKPKLPEATSGG